MHRPEQPVAAAVAGEHPAGPVGAVRGRGQPEHDDPGVGVAEARDRLAPVRLVPVGGPLLDGHLLTPCPKPRAGGAGDHLTLETGEIGMPLRSHRQ